MAAAHHRRLLTITAISLVLLGLAAFGFLVRVRHTLRQTERAVAADGHLPYTLTALKPPVNPGFEAVQATNAFRSAAGLDGEIFLATAGALTLYSAAGVPEKTFHVGQELPSSPLGPMMTARMRTQSAPHVFLATAGAGVLIYDAATRSFEQLLPRDPALADVTALAMSSSGELLLGTRRHGVLVFDGSTLQSFRQEYANTSITSLLAPDGDVWAGTQDHGLLHTHAGVTERFDDVLPDPHIEALAAAAGRVFAATPLGVAEFDDGRLARTLAPESFAHALFATAAALTLSTMTEGIRTVSLTSERRTPSAEANSAEPAEQLLTLPGSDDIFAVRHDGMFRRSGSHWTSVLTPQRAALTDSNIAALGFAEDGRLWVGSFDRGLDILDTAGGAADHLEDDHLFCINRIVLDPERHTMAVATANGLVLFDATGKPRQVLTRRDGLIADHVTDVVYSRSPQGDERMTVATPAGLTFIDNGGVRSMYAFQGLVNNHVYALASAASGDELLAGTLGGVSLLSQDAVRRNLTVANSALKHNWITAALPFEGAFLVGTYGAGVMQLDTTGHFAAMGNATRSMVINPNAMLATSTHVFAGSLGQGLWSYSRASRRWTQVTGGLPSLNVTAMAARDGELYVGTQNGLVRIAESKLPL